jgi:hypothetical protein
MLHGHLYQGLNQMIQSLQEERPLPLRTCSAGPVYEVTCPAFGNGQAEESVCPVVGLSCKLLFMECSK